QDTLTASAVSCASVRVILFFFSSRRRHTRLVSDWSSDVCSSDLFIAAKFLEAAKLILNNPAAMKLVKEADAAGIQFGGYAEDGRSEERRVGKECRAWGSPEH